MSARIGLGIGIADLDDFNRRAAKAMRACEFKTESFDERFARSIIQQIETRRPLTEKQQLTLYQVITRNRGRIWDALVVEWASARTKEYAQAPLFEGVR